VTTKAISQKKEWFYKSGLGIVSALLITSVLWGIATLTNVSPLPQQVEQNTRNVATALRVIEKHETTLIAHTGMLQSLSETVSNLSKAVVEADKHTSIALNNLSTQFKYSNKIGDIRNELVFDLVETQKEVLKTQQIFGREQAIRTSTIKSSNEHMADESLHNGD